MAFWSVPFLAGLPLAIYGWNRRKKTLSDVVGLMRFRFVPLLEIPLLVDQFVVVKSGFSCKAQFVQEDGHDTLTLLLEGLRVSVGTFKHTEIALKSFAQIKSGLPSPLTSIATAESG